MLMIANDHPMFGDGESFGRSIGSYRCVPLHCPSSQQACRSLIPYSCSVHAPPHNAAAQGLQVSLRHIPQYLLLYRQLRHYPFQSRILLLQFLQPSGLV